MKPVKDADGPRARPPIDLHDQSTTPPPGRLKGQQVRVAATQTRDGD